MSENLKECYTDGPFRGDKCPVCGLPSKLLMNGKEVDALSRILAGMLRHFPERYGIRLNDHGWVRIGIIIPVIKVQGRYFNWLTQKHIEALVKTDPKERYEINENGEIRARYGHTIPVNLDDMPTDGIPEKLYYQTTAEEFDFIKETGISPSDKTWIHLSKTYRQAYISGLFHVDDPLVVEINTAEVIESGMPIYRATDDIFVVARIPPEFVRESPVEEVTPTEEEKIEIDRVKQKRERKKAQEETGEGEGPEY